MAKRKLIVSNAIREPRAKIQRVITPEHTFDFSSSSAQPRLETLPDELLLRILSLLSATQLAIYETLSRRIFALARDPQLWRHLYFERFVRCRSLRRGSRQKLGLLDSLQLVHSRQSSSQKSLPTIEEVDWRSQYKLRSKWLNGLYRYREISIGDRIMPRAYLCLQGEIAITADEYYGLRAWKTKGQEQTLLQDCWFRPSARLSNPDLIPSAMSIEPSRSDGESLYFAVAFVTGEVGLYCFHTAKRHFTTLQLFPCCMNQSVLTLSLLDSYLAVISDTQVLSLFKLRQGSHSLDGLAEVPKLLSSVNSQTAKLPLSLSLKVKADSLVVSIAYAYAAYRAGWSVGLQELVFSFDGILQRSRNANALQADPPPPRAKANSPAKRRRHSPAFRAVALPPTNSKPTSLSYSHPYLLATHPDNTLSVYLVCSTDANLSVNSGHRLWGHTSEVCAAQIGDRGKAVTVAHGGEIRVWELEGGLASSQGRGSGTAASVQLCPQSQGHNRMLDCPEDSGVAKLRYSTVPTGGNSIDSDATERVGTTWVDFDEERLVVLKSNGSKSRNLYIYDFT